MPKIKYREFNFQPAALAMIATVNTIIADYRSQGFDLTLRQVYYQLVARDLFPADRTWRWTGSKWVRDPKGTTNAEPNYKWLGSIVNDGRLAGLIDWDAIVDRTRNLRSQAHWTNPEDIIAACASQFRLDKWKTQRRRVEVWIEKDALVGVIEGVCNELDLPHFSCRGYTSQSEMWGAAQRLRGYVKAKQTPIILHLGDHDPSGVDMTRDIEERLALFVGRPVEVRRLALNMDPVEEYSPPPNPAKLTDARAQGYIAEHGSESWELDALEPAVIGDLIRREVDDLRNPDAWGEVETEQAEHRERLSGIAGNYERVVELLDEIGGANE